jgi:hypothetical protein
MEYLIPKRFQTFVSKSSGSSEFRDRSWRNGTRPRRLAKRDQDAWPNAYELRLVFLLKAGKKRSGCFRKEAD